MNSIFNKITIIGFLLKNYTSNGFVNSKKENFLVTSTFEFPGTSPHYSLLSGFNITLSLILSFIFDSSIIGKNIAINKDATPEIKRIIEHIFIFFDFFLKAAPVTSTVVLSVGFIPPYKGLLDIRFLIN